MTIISSSRSLAVSRVLRRLGIFGRINRTTTHRLDGLSVEVPIIAGLQADITEEWMLALLQHLLSLGPGSFVDVGVNMGQTLMKVRAIDPERAYRGFEPNPVCVYYAEELIAANGWQNCDIVPAGLGRETTVATLNLYHGRSGDSSASIIDDFRPDEAVSFRKTVVIFGSSDVPARLLADKIAVVKIDVEGAEADVLAALEPHIARDRPLISMEVLPCYGPDRQDRIARQAQIETLLRAHDYRILRVRHDQQGGRFTLVPIDSIGIHGDLALCEYVMSPRERLAEVLPV